MVEVALEGVVAGLGALTAGVAPVLDGDLETSFLEVGATAAAMVTVRFGDALTLRRNAGRGAVARRAGRFPSDGRPAT